LENPVYQELIDNLEPKFEVDLKAEVDKGLHSERDILLRGFTSVSSALQLERIYRFIFGSQIKAISLLAEYGGPTSKEDIKFLYHEAVAEHPDFYKDYSFDQWTDYMVREKMIEQNNDKLIISIYGRAFLTYLIDHNLNRNLSG
jgi:hypothetical protein